MNEIVYSSQQITEIFGIVFETVRAWSQEFEQYLSPRANPGKNRRRAFTYSDLEVFALVSELKKQGLTFADIHAALDNGQRGSVSDIIGKLSLESDPTPEEYQLTVAVKELQLTIVQLEKERDLALNQLQELQKTHEEALKQKVKAEYLEQQLTAANNHIQGLIAERLKLEREIGEAYSKGAMDVLRKRGDLPSD